MIKINNGFYPISKNLFKTVQMACKISIKKIII